MGLSYDSPIVLYEGYIMKKIRLYTVKREYIDYLSQFDNNIMHSDGENYKSERKYIGIVLSIGEYNYFAPLSSPKDSDYFYKNGKKHIRKSIVPIIRLITQEGILLSKVKLCSMIPVPSDCLTLYDYDNERDIKYKTLIAKEIICLRKQKDLIFKNAQILYNQKINNYEGINYLKSTVNFILAEKYCSKYKFSKST